MSRHKDRGQLEHRILVLIGNFTDKVLSSNVIGDAMGPFRPMIVLACRGATFLAKGSAMHYRV